MIKISSVVKVILFWATLILPILLFRKLFRMQISDYTGIYDNAIFFIVLISLILTILDLWSIPKYFERTKYKISSIASYTLFYVMSCIAIGWDYRVNFGATWQYSEIFPELIIPLWYFYLFGLLGLFFYYKFQHLIANKTRSLNKG